MLDRRSVSALAFVLHALPLLILAIAVLSWVLQSPASVRAEPPQDPLARLQVVVKSVYVLDDQEWFGSGEMALGMNLLTCDDRAAVHPCWRSEDFPPRAVAGAVQKFSASSGDTVPLDRVFPQPGDRVDSLFASEEVGLAVYPGRAYRLAFGMYELDPTAVELAQCFTLVLCEPDPSLGTVSLDLDEALGLGIGTHTTSSSTADYSLTFEIRRTPLPDLHPTGIEVLAIPGGGESVCLGVQNLGQQDAGPFEMVFRLDGQEVLGGTVAGGQLPAGQAGQLCLPAALPRGVHTLSATVDEARAVPEMDEHNNVFERQFVRTAGGAVGGLPEGPSGVKPPEEPADLLVSGLRVGHNADGSGTCRGDQDNYLFAELQNLGPGAAGEFALGLAVGGDLKQERVYVQGLAAGETVEARLATNDLNSGPQTVAVIADSDSQVAETDEANNAFEITADCD